MRLSYLNAVEEELLSALVRPQAAFAIVGGHAVLCYTPAECPDGSFRTLGDLDVLVATDPSNLEKVSRALADIRIELSPDQLRDTFINRKLPNLVRHRAQLFPEILGVRTDNVLSQVVTADSSIGALPVISSDHLLAAKKAAARPKDLEDVLALERSRSQNGLSSFGCAN
jgi:hypothetical protein